MLPDTYAIVDVETTGQSAVYGRVIEVAVIRVEQGVVTARFSSLVNPERYISPMIQSLTGISNDDVAGAPVFSRIAPKLRKLLDGAVFVAHNARFDYSFLKNEFAALGIPFSPRCLCTVKLSRRLFPDYRRHDLSSLIERHELTCDARHRAMGDAEAVHAFLRLVTDTVERDRLQEVVRQILKSGSIPSQLDRESVDTLPDAPGVYLFYGRDSELLYVGKSINIRERVRSHFSGDMQSAKEGEMCRQIARIDHRRTAGELGALLLESHLIKELRPIYNAVARRKRGLIVARRTTGRDRYTRVVLEQIDHIDADTATSILGVFKHFKQASEFLAVIAREHRLCPKLLGIEQGHGCCFHYHLRQCDGACIGEEDPAPYNTRVEEAFARRRVKAWPYQGGIVIEEKEGRTGQGEVFLIDNWCLVSSFRYSDFGMSDIVRGSHRFDYDSYKILARYLQTKSNKRNIRQLRREDFDRLLAGANAG